MNREAQLFEELDATTSTPESRRLGPLLPRRDDSDKLWALALLSGRRPRRPVTSTQLRQWAAEVAGIPDWLFEASYHVVGDFAETVTHIATLEIPVEQPPSAWVQEVEALRGLEEEEQARRVKAAWAGLEGMALFVFNKVLTGGFRIGVSQEDPGQGAGQGHRHSGRCPGPPPDGRLEPAPTTFEELVLEPTSTDDDACPYPFYLAWRHRRP